MLYSRLFMKVLDTTVSDMADRCLRNQHGRSWLIVVVCCYVAMACAGILLDCLDDSMSSEVGAVYNYAYAQVDGAQSRVAGSSGIIPNDVEYSNKRYISKNNMPVPSWREVGPWAKLKWLVDFAPKRGNLLTEDSIVELIDELITVGTVYERRDFLRNELREQLVLSFVVKNNDLRRRLAELYLVGASDAFEDKQYVLAESFTRTSLVIFPGLEGQQSLQNNIDKVFWRSNAGYPWYRSSYMMILLIATGGALCVWILPSSLFVSKVAVLSEVEQGEVGQCNIEPCDVEQEATLEETIEFSKVNDVRLTKTSLDIEVESNGTQEELDIFCVGDNRLDDDFEFDERCDQDDDWVDGERVWRLDRLPKS